jgi:hypothetical protein
MPFLALATMFVMQRWIDASGRYRRLAVFTSSAVFAVLLALAGIQAVTARTAVAERHQAEKDQFEAAAIWLADHADPGDVVMTTQTYTLNYVSGHPCIALPGNEPPDAAWEAAQRYGARYLVITQTFGQYPQVLKDSPDARFQLLEEREGMSAYAITGD